MHWPIVSNMYPVPHIPFSDLRDRPQPSCRPQRNGLTVQQHPHYPSGLGAVAHNIDPFVRHRTLHAHVSLAHNALFARVKPQLEYTLHHNTIVNCQRPVHQQYYARTKVDHAHYGSTLNMERRLYIRPLASRSVPGHNHPTQP